MERNSEQLNAELSHVVYHNSDNGWAVLRLSGDLTAVGSVPFPLAAGESLLLSGTWKAHASYGRQFQFSRIEKQTPATEAAIIKYLGSGLFRGIKQKTAEKIVARFGLRTLEVLDANPLQLKKIPGIGKKTVGAIAESWEEQRSSVKNTLFLYQYDITGALAQKIIRCYGNDTISILKQNPYRLMRDVRGVAFPTADRIAMSLGMPKDAPQRVRECVLYLIESFEDKGHCYITHTQLKDFVFEKLGLGLPVDDILEAALVQLEYDCEIHNETLPEGERIHYRRDLFLCEQHVAKLLAKHIKLAKTYDEGLQNRTLTWLERYKEQSRIEPSEEQTQALLLAAQSKIFILTGGPGVGKSTTVFALLRLFKAMGKSVGLAAPTGRAAQRLTEITGQQAKTLHRLLEWTDSGFNKNEENPLPFDVVIADEVSMLDIKLAEQLIRAVPKHGQLILVGDMHQLPSIGAGNVLCDLLESSLIPSVRLNKIFRQAESSQIIQVAHCINRGEAPSFSNAPESDCHFIDKENPEDVLRAIELLVSETLPNLGYKPKEDIQVLSPMNRGDLGSIHINQRLQALLNPPRPGLPELKRRNFTLRCGDKVIQTSNNYELNVFNGDIGIVEMAKVDGGKVLVSFEGRLVAYEEDQVEDLSLAYCISIHKSQGSEFKAVVLPCSMSRYVMLQRNLFYTGLTRAKKLAIFVGAKKALNFATRNQESRLRQSRLAARLQTELVNA